ncbi:ABC transporter permease [Vibrio sp. CAIM 722]|uniref:ABC transporter permease n=2 Tax=Vibrio eleionomae TaxID=2653505 RepID=A0A7X4LLD8_9VIBR|nr:ABC transporter permease [Vibrio eleionomae]
MGANDMIKPLWWEIRALFTNSVVLLTVFGGVFFYSFLYPLPYQHQTPREQKIAVVNLDKSQASYQLERMIDATPQLHIVQRLNALKEAQQSFLDHNIAGYLVIPEHFYRDLVLGTQPTLAFAGDASYFLVYGTVVEGLTTAAGTLSAKAKITRLLSSGESIESATREYAPSKINLKPTFNTRMGYVDYVVPAVFVLILQQTMIMASGLIGGTQKHQHGYWNQLSVGKVMVVRLVVLVAVYYVLSMYYFGGSFSFHGINRVASTSALVTLLLPFLITSCLIGIFLGAWTPHREYVTLVVLVSSMPLVFSAGFIWPLESMPKALVWLADCFPSTPAIQGFLALNQMGATWQQIAPQWTLLWGQALIWAGLAYWQFKRRGR